MSVALTDDAIDGAFMGVLRASKSLDSETVKTVIAKAEHRLQLNEDQLYELRPKTELRTRVEAAFDRFNASKSTAPAITNAAPVPVFNGKSATKPESKPKPKPTQVGDSDDEFDGEGSSNSSKPKPKQKPKSTPVAAATTKKKKKGSDSDSDSDEFESKSKAKPKSKSGKSTSKSIPKPKGKAAAKAAQTPAEYRLDRLKKLGQIHGVIIRNPPLSTLDTSAATERLEAEFTKRKIDFAKNVLTDAGLARARLAREIKDLDTRNIIPDSGRPPRAQPRINYAVDLDQESDDDDDFVSTPPPQTKKRDSPAPVPAADESEPEAEADAEGEAPDAVAGEDETDAVAAAASVNESGDASGDEKSETADGSASSAPARKRKSRVRVSDDEEEWKPAAMDDAEATHTAVATEEKKATDDTGDTSDAERDSNDDTDDSVVASKPVTVSGGKKQPLAAPTASAAASASGPSPISLVAAKLPAPVSAAGKPKTLLTPNIATPDRLFSPAGAAGANAIPPSPAKPLPQSTAVKTTPEKKNSPAGPPRAATLALGSKKRKVILEDE